MAGERFRRVLAAIGAGMRRLDDHWLGDVIGVISLMITGYIGFFIAGILQ